MQDFWSQVIPIIIIFFVGFLLQKAKIFGSNTADTLLRVSFFVTLPSLTFLSGATAELNLKYVLLPFIAIFTMLLIALISAPIARKFKMTSPTHGTFYIGTLIMNTGFTLPFVLAAFGNQGLAIYTIFDFGNSLMIFTFAYYFAIKFGKKNNSKIPVRKFLLLPPIWGLILGIAVNIFQIELSATVSNFFSIVGQPTIFLIIFSLGLYFQPHIYNLGKMFTVFSLRIGVGLLLGWSFTVLFGFDGIVKTLVIVFCGAPVGYNTLIFSSLEGLDKEFAASLVSISLLLGIVYVPLLLFWL